MSLDVFVYTFSKKCFLKSNNLKELFYFIMTMNSWTVKNLDLCKALGVESRGYRSIDLVKSLWKYIRIHRLSNSFQIDLDPFLEGLFGVSKTSYSELKSLFEERYVVAYRPIIKLKRKERDAIM